MVLDLGCNGRLAVAVEGSKVLNELGNADRTWIGFTVFRRGIQGEASRPNGKGGSGRGDAETLESRSDKKKSNGFQGRVEVSTMNL